MQCETFRAITVPGSEGEWGVGSGEWGLRKGAPSRLALPAPLHLVLAPPLPTPHSILPPRSLWPPACVLVKTDATRRQYGYCETETGRQKEHQEGAGGVARNVVERTL